MSLLRRFGWFGLTLMMLVSACAPPAPTSTPEPAPTQALPPTLADLPTLPPTWTPAQPIRLIAREELTLRAGPQTTYHEVGLMPDGHEGQVIGRDQDRKWVEVRYGTLVGWVWVERDAVEIDGDLAALPIVPVPPITQTPTRRAPTLTPYPTFTLRPSMTPRVTVTLGPTPEDRDQRTRPAHDFGVLGATFAQEGSGSLTLPDDEFDYIGFKFDPNLSGRLAVELEFTCDNPDAELLLTLFSSQRRERELAHLYPVCNQGPLTFQTLEPGNWYQVRIWLREANLGFVEATPEGGTAEPKHLEVDYSFTLRNPQ